MPAAARSAVMLRHYPRAVPRNAQSSAAVGTPARVDPSGLARGLACWMGDTPGPSEVAPGLWLGALSSLAHLAPLGVTHVVSAVNAPGEVRHEQLERCARLLLDLADEEGANLLQQLPGAVEFIAAALQSGGRVLVHCAQGVSRSAAVAAAYLMYVAQQGRQQPLGAQAAVAALRGRHPSAAPNAGFMRQLELWGAMGCRLDAGHVPYKRFVLEQAGRRYEETGSVEAATLSTPSELDAAPTLYRCRKCRCLIATAHNVVEVEQGPGASAFRWRKRDKHQRQSLGSGEGGGGEAAGSDGSLFVEPLRWMCEGEGLGSILDGTVQGKLYCPKCHARLGSFNWAGTQSSSGAWVTPAFQLHLSKLDAMDPNAPAPLATLRQPRLLGSSSGAAEAGPVLAPSAVAERAGARQPWVTHLVLDCDGVLVDSERASCEALRQAILQVTNFDIPHDFPADFVPVFGMDVTTCLEFYSSRYASHAWGDVGAVASDVAAAKEPIYQQLTAGGIAPFPGVRELVAQARALGLGVAVASSGSPDKIAHNLGSSGLADLFDPRLVVSAKHVARGKPAPDVFLEALARLGCSDASRALVVEDAVNGLKAARAAGCYSVGITNSLPADALAGHAHMVIAHLSELDLAAVQPPALE